MKESRLAVKESLHTSEDADRRVNCILIPIATAAFGLYLIFSEITGFTPACIFHLLTGWNCPGCGCQRALHAAIKGEWWKAWQFNYLLPFAAVYILLLIILPFLRLRRRSASPTLYERLTSVMAGRMLLCIILIWWIIRNIFQI